MRLLHEVKHKEDPLNTGWIIREKKAYYDPDGGALPVIGIWHGALDELTCWLREQDYDLYKLEVAPWTNLGLMLRLTHDPNRADEVTDVLGADMDELASYDHQGDWQPLT